MIGCVENLTDFGVAGPNFPGQGFGHNPSQWNLAWAAHAGVAYNVSKNFKVELAYRYLNMGSISDTIDCVGGCLPDSYKLREVTSHDFKLGLRWVCCDDSSNQQQYYAPQPAYVAPPQQQVLQLPPQQQYVAPPPQQYYAPPPAPAYQQPLMRKG